MEKQLSTRRPVKLAVVIVAFIAPRDGGLAPVDRWGLYRVGGRRKRLARGDRTVRLLHRDWYLRNDRPANFVAVGWMYSQKDHRDQLTAAFRRVPEIAIRTTIVPLITDENVFVERYIKRQNEALAKEWTPIVAKGEGACVAHARSMREKYLNNDWQSPTDGTPVDDVKDLSEALNVIERFFDSGTRGKVAQPSL